VLKHLVERQLSFIFFLFGLVIIYISIHYAFGRTLMEGRRLEQELKSLYAAYTTSTAELEFHRKSEEVSRRLAQFGSKVHAPTAPPKRMMMEEYQNE
jgi:hypothetical protein